MIDVTAKKLAATKTLIPGIVPLAAWCEQNAISLERNSFLIPRLGILSSKSQGDFLARLRSGMEMRLRSKNKPRFTRGRVSATMELSVPNHHRSGEGRFVCRPPVAAAVWSHFSACPDSHSQFCFHGTCRFLLHEEKPACICQSGYIGSRCERVDLLAVVAANQKKQTITALVVVSVIACVVLIMVCVLIQ
ncbi:hypothetical protein JD844_030938 [Phrynosoma platyrhinos]|uniref:EGF-like domain-containing protein n=1 Tax=Phrynosoma platyrhinos TaxID=52577 RepID=A0ABQ7T0C7_PHRPL|nr:hypothetical protein JD844_030938 [Phrynosoma platyrhinos]